MHWRGTDPRWGQILVLAGLYGYGVLWLDFAVPGTHAVGILSTVLLVQWGGDCCWQRRPYDPRSALISGLSLCLLLRTNHLSLAVATAGLAIASKWILRWRGKHVFNPTNGALVAMMLATDQVWVSPGQWGSAVFFAFALASCGWVVVSHAVRRDVTVAFLASHIALRLGRAWWLGDPWSIPLHQLQNGALVLFAFFMLSDPRTTPNSRLGRLLFAVLVAVGGWYIQFRYYRSDALLWSLAVGSLLVPILDVLLPGPRYTWLHPKGDTHVFPQRASRSAPVFRQRRPGLLRLLRRQSRHQAVQQSLESGPGTPRQQNRSDDGE